MPGVGYNRRALKRARRIFFNALTLLSLLLFLATVVLWVRSYWHHQYVLIQGGGSYGRGFNTWQVTWFNGRISLYRATVVGFISPGARDLSKTVDGYVRVWSEPPTPATPPMPPDPLRFLRDLYRFEVHRSSGRQDYWLVDARGPGWVPPVGLAVVPLFHLRRRRNPRDSLRCARCGYDLRATPERCPECGTIAAR